jgi:hypothetical protein
MNQKHLSKGSPGITREAEEKERHSKFKHEWNQIPWKQKAGTEEVRKGTDSLHLYLKFLVMQSTQTQHINFITSD